MGLLDFFLKPPKKAPRILRPLTHAASKAMGHVLWIESKDPLHAFDEMYTGLQKAPYNCAIWANAGDRIPSNDLKLIQDWRKANNLDVPFGVKKPERDNQSVRKFGADYLRIYFNQLAVANRGKENIDRVIDIIYRHMNDNFEGMNNIIPSTDMVLELRGKGSTKPGFDKEHIDGDRDAEFPALQIKLRVLQSIASFSTCLIANEDVVLNRESKNRTYLKYQSDPKKPVTVWQTPRNSVIMLSNSSHHCQPILHSDAVTPIGLPNQPRIVSVTGLAL